MQKRAEVETIGCFPARELKWCAENQGGANRWARPQAGSDATESFFAIVPVTRGGGMILINQYRYSVDQWCLEIPAGGTHDKPNETLEEVAWAELREEVGGGCGAMKYVDWFYLATSLTDEKCHVFLAEDVVLSEAEREEDNSIEVKVVSVAEALALVRRGKMKDGQCARAIHLCEPLLPARAESQGY